MSSSRIEKALALAVEVSGARISEAAAEVIARDLAAYPEAWVLGALERCRRELKGRLTLADVIERLADGRPSAEEAWAQVATEDEGRTLVATQEAYAAMADARPLLAENRAAAWAAFRRRYEALVSCARERGTPAQWCVSLGHDRAGREGPVVEAVRLGRLPADFAARLLGLPEESLLALAPPGAAPMLALAGARR